MSQIVPYAPPAEFDMQQLQSLKYYYPENHRFRGRYNVFSDVSVFKTIKKNVSKEQWEALKCRCFGTIFRIGDKLAFLGTAVHAMMMHEVKTKKSKELWFKVKDEIARFSMVEFAAITGLNCAEVDVDVPEVSMEDVLGVDKCKLGDLKDMLCKEKNSKRKMMLAYLLVVEGVLLPHRPNTNISTEHAALVSDMDKFQRYPWGRKIYQATIDALSKISQAKHTSPNTGTRFNLGGYPLSFEVNF